MADVIFEMFIGIVGVANVLFVGTFLQPSGGINTDQ